WPEAPSSLVLTVDIRVGDVAVRLFTTIATLGTAQDITLQELHIESFHPADAATEQLLRALAGEVISPAAWAAARATRGGRGSSRCPRPRRTPPPSPPAAAASSPPPPPRPA